MGGAERITPPVDLGTLARDTEREFEAASEIRPLMPGCAVPWLMVTCDELRQMPLTSRDGYVLSLIDGCLTVEMIVDLASLSADETLGALAKLLKLGAIELRDRSSR